MNRRIHQGWEQGRMWAKLLYPSSLLKVFPPRFVLRDVVREQAEPWLAQGKRCTLLYFALTPSPDRHEKLFPASRPQAAAEAVHLFRDAIRVFIDQDDLLAADHRHGLEYVVLVNEPPQPMAQESLLHLQNRMISWIASEWSRRALGEHPPVIAASVDVVEPCPEGADVALFHAVQRARLAAGPRRDQSATASDIRRIIEEEDIRVLAQPIVSLSSGTVQGWEMLTRGPRHTSYEQPVRLFQCADQADLLLPLELLVVKKALQQLHRQKAAVPAFINVTAPSLLHPEFYDGVKRLLREHPSIRPEQITLEITERHAIENYAEFRRSMEAFRREGFKIAIDDTGAGYSSLHMISEVLPDFMKIDRSIIQDIDVHEVKDSILQALLYVAERIGCHVVAEGIETEAEAALLLKRKVAFGQGYFFARPFEPLAAEAVGG